MNLGVFFYVLSHKFRKSLFYFRASLIAPFHFIPKNPLNCPYFYSDGLNNVCPIWNCKLHYTSLNRNNALFTRGCNQSNLII